MHTDFQERSIAAIASATDESFSEAPATFPLSSRDTQLPVEQPTKQIRENLAESPLLARISAPAAQALNRIYTWTSPLAFRVRDSDYQAWWDDAAEPAAPCRSYRFQFGPAKGWLTLEPLAERELLGDADDDAVPESLRRVLFADALASLLSTLENHTRRTIELLPESDEESVAGKQEIGSVFFRVSKLAAEHTRRGAIRFDDERFLELICPAAPPPSPMKQREWNAVRVPIVFRVGTTSLTVEEMRGLTRGDIVGIETWASVGKALVVSAQLPGVPTQSIIGLADGSRVVIDKIQETAMKDNRPATAPEARDAQSNKLGSLEALEVTMTFELGKHVLKLSELKALQPGYVIELAQPLNQSVIRILANDSLVGHGHLIAIGDKLGVRVTQFAQSDV
jgi:type III secretion protein Q